MNEMDLVREFRADLPVTAPATLASARRELLRATRVRPLYQFGLPRLRWQLAVMGGLAVVVALSLLVAYRPGGGPGTEARPDSEAVKVLRLAAQTAQNAPYPTPRPDQFVLVESVTAYESSSRSGTRIVPTDRRIWLSIDGAHDGVLFERPRSSTGPWRRSPLPGCRNGKAAAIKGDQVVGQQDCTVSESSSPILASLPANTDDMVDYLYRHGRHVGSERATDRQAWTMVGDVIGESYGRPAVVSALFSAAARIPGVSVIDDVVDAAGRHGIAVARTAGGVRQELIFDPKTYAFLGERDVATKDTDEHKKGAVVGSSAITRTAITDRVGTLP